MPASLVEFPTESPSIVHEGVTQTPVHGVLPGFSPHRETGDITWICSSVEVAPKSGLTVYHL